MTTITEQNLRDAKHLSKSFCTCPQCEAAQMRFDAALAEAVAELEKMPNVSESYEQYVRSEMADGRAREKFDPTDC